MEQKYFKNWVNYAVSMVDECVFSHSLFVWNFIEKFFSTWYHEAFSPEQRPPKSDTVRIWTQYMCYA